MNLKARRKEALLLLLTVIVLALLIDLLGSVIFSAFYESHKVPFIVAISIGLVGASVFGYFSVLSRTEKTLVGVRFPFCFSQRLQRFIDIPNCPPSVYARVHFDWLSPGVRKDYALLEIGPRFFDCDFDHFLNDVVQATLLTLLFRRDWLREEDRELLKFQDLPEALKRNACLRREADHHSSRKRLNDYSLSIPKWAKLETYGRYERFIRLVCKYGNIAISWRIKVCSGTLHTRPYITLLGEEPDSGIYDFLIEVSMSYKCRYSWMHSRDLDEYVEWVLEVKQRLEELDWKRTREMLSLVILESILKEIRQPSSIDRTEAKE